MIRKPVDPVKYQLLLNQELQSWFKPLLNFTDMDKQKVACVVTNALKVAINIAKAEAEIKK